MHPMDSITKKLPIQQSIFYICSAFNMSNNDLFAVFVLLLEYCGIPQTELFPTASNFNFI